MIAAEPAAEPVGETLATRAGSLFRQVQAGDSSRMDELVALVTPILWHTARSQRLDSQSAEDVLQTAWLALMRNLDTIADSQAVLQWLIVCTRRESWRVQRRDDRNRHDELEADDLAEPVAGPEVHVTHEDESARLWRHVATLPERCRVLLRVIAFADRPDYVRVATALGMPVGSIGPTRGRCLAKLRSLLAAEADAGEGSW